MKQFFDGARAVVITLTVLVLGVALGSFGSSAAGADTSVSAFYLAIGGSGFQYRSSAGYRGSDSYAVKICMQSSRGQGCSTVTFNADIN